MKRFLQIFFLTLGIIFFVLILAGVYLYVVDPFNLKPLLSSQATTLEVDDSDGDVTAAEGSDASDSVVTDKNPALSATQEQTLETFGIDPASLPATITPAQEVCFTAVLGADRVAEIKSGDTPSVVEFFRARSCLD